MFDRPTSDASSEAAAAALRVYLLGAEEFEKVLRLQRSLVYQVMGERHTAALVVCEHAPIITVGREGRPGHLRFDRDEPRARQWAVRWVNRGGGCWLHAPGQLAAYPVLALDQLGLGLEAYRDRLHEVLLAVLDDFGIPANTRPGRAGVWVRDRLIATVGIAVRDWVAYFGLTLNIHPDLTAFRLVHTDGDLPMTSIERERRGPLRSAMVRERLVEHFSQRFSFERTALFFDHPLLRRPAPALRAGATA